MSQVFWRVLLDPEQDLWRVGDQGRKLKDADVTILRIMLSRCETGTSK